MSERDLVPDVRKIAVLRGGGLGDLVFALPALDALRVAYREAEIVLLGREWLRALLDGRPGPIDRFVALPEIGWLGGDGGSGDAGSADERAETLADEDFDLAVQLHGGGRHSNPFIQRLRARVSVGLRAPDAPALDRTVPYVYYQSEVMRGLEVVSLVGAEPVGVAPRYHGLRPADRAVARRLLPPGTGRLAVIHPSATDPRRRWPAESFAAVGEALSRAGALVLVTGTGSEAPLVAEVVRSTRAGALDLAGAVDLPMLAGLLAEADVVVGNDSGPLHLAAAVGAATVGIYWCGNLINAGPFTRLRHRPVLSWQLACPVCGVDCTRATCPHRASFVADASLDEVVEAALDLLASKGRGDRGATPETSPAPADGVPVAV